MVGELGWDLWEETLLSPAPPIALGHMYDCMISNKHPPLSTHPSTHHTHPPSYVPYKDQEDAQEEADNAGGAVPLCEEADSALQANDKHQPRQEEKVA